MNSTIPTILAALHAATDQLQAASTSPRLDAELILAHLMAVSRTHILTRLRDPFPAHLTAYWQHLIAQRATGVPVAYLIHQREFYGLDFYVDARVLVPRPETELLVDIARDAAAILAPHCIADIGTGSGCIAVSLAVNRVAPVIIGVDISPAALAVAHINQQRHGCTDHLHLVCGDLCTMLAPLPLIVSNPPYTLLDDIDANVRTHEPHLALAGGGIDGADYYRRLAQLLPRHLATPGIFACEIDPRQAATVVGMMRATLPNAHISVHADLAGWERVVRIQQ
jgi:release factor glutamine methyltransferase